MKKLFKEFIKGIGVQNPTFGMILGLCPTLAVSTSLINALGMGLAATFVLMCSNSIISTLRKFIPDAIRLPAYIVIIATFVSVIDMLMKAYSPELNKALGIFVPLIVVNCIILARAESFASKNRILPSLFDGLGMGIGFTLGLSSVAFFRELFGSGSVFNIKVGFILEPVILFRLAPGALLTLGLLIALVNYLKARKGKSPIARKGGCC